MSVPELIYKVAAGAVIAEADARGELVGTPVDLADGYIHFSTAAQLAETLKRHFRDQQDLVLLAVRTGDIAAGLRWEKSRGGDLFPHLYQALPMDAVAWRAPVSVDADGHSILPEGVR